MDTILFFSSSTLGIICTFSFSHKDNLYLFQENVKCFCALAQYFQWVHQKSWSHGCDYNLKCQVYTNVRSWSGSLQPLPPFPPLLWLCTHHNLALHHRSDQMFYLQSLLDFLLFYSVKLNFIILCYKLFVSMEAFFIRLWTLWGKWWLFYSYLNS